MLIHFEEEAWIERVLGGLGNWEGLQAPFNGPDIAGRRFLTLDV
jgi:hypothetical protein